MKKLQMSKTETITFEEGCNKYLDDCRQRNLRQGTINIIGKATHSFINTLIIVCQLLI